MNELFRQVEIDIENKFIEIDDNIRILRDDIEYPNFHGLVDVINITINLENGDILNYQALDDIFKSYTGKYYMKVFIDRHFIEINIDKILMVTNVNIDQKSNIVTNWLQIKQNILRNEKINRLI